MITPIKFNDTDDYTPMTVLQTHGVYSPNRIQADTLPEGFHRYELCRSHSTRFAAVQKSRAVHYAGDYITADNLVLDEAGKCPLSEDDWVLQQEPPFDFESFWGYKLSFEKTVANAEQKRDLQMGKVPKTRSIQQEQTTAIALTME